MQSIKRERKRYQKDSAPADDIITLIHLVRQNPALYNYKLKPSQRRRTDVLNGWVQIAAQIGNKYTVEECRRKWKNLRDTYHQYRLRKPKLNDGLSKWRYAKELDFLSQVYRPKMKSQRQQHFDLDIKGESLLQGVPESMTHDDHDDHDHKVVDGDLVHHPSITLVNDDAETFILTAYEDVNDDMDHAAAHMELSHHPVDVTHIVKNEHTSSLDGTDDGAAGDVDYEEVCLYEEAANAPSVDCETIIPGNGSDMGGAGTQNGPGSPNDGKAFQYIDDNDFCIESISDTHTQLPVPTAPSNNALKFALNTGVKIKNVVATVVSNVSAMNTAPSNVSVFTTAALPNVVLDQNHSTMAAVTPSSTVYSGPVTPPSILQLQAVNTNRQTREELDLFFDFLKKKMQRFSKEEITAIQVEFLNCVLRREADLAQRHPGVAATVTL